MLPAPIIPTASKPYLGAIGAPPIRFEEPAPPPDLVTRPAAAAPPQPAAKEAMSTDITPAATTSSLPISPAGVPVSTAATPTTSIDSDPHSGSESPASTSKQPAPILRDELHQQTHAEDFLPFFQIPTSQPGDVTIVPVPRTPPPLPNSSATYTQSPK